MTKKEKEIHKHLLKIYNCFYDEGKRLFEKYDVCQIRHSEKGNSCCGGKHKPLQSFCCDECKFLTKNGCRVKSLDCKLWICYTIRCRIKDGELKEFNEKLTDLMNRSRLLRGTVRRSRNCSVSSAAARYKNFYGEWDKLFREGQQKAET